MSEPKEKTISLYRGDTASKEFYIENIDPADFSAISVRLEAKRADNNETVIGFDILDSDSGNDWPNNLLVANFLSAYTQNIVGEDTIILKYDIEVTRVNGSVVQVTSEYFGLILLEADVTVGNPVITPETTVDIYANLASTNDTKGASYIGVKSSLWSGIATTVQGALEWLKANYLQFTGSFAAGRLLKTSGTSAQATVSGISISNDDALTGIKSASVTDAPTVDAHLTRKDYVDNGLATKENIANKSTNTALGSSDSLYPSQNAVKVFVENSVSAASVGFLKDRGNYNASSNLFPSTGGSGSSGAIETGNLWTISVAGTLGGQAVTPGDVVRSLVNAPGQTASNWAILENNFGYVAENSANKNQNSGYAGLDSSGNFVQNSDRLTEGSTNQWFTAARVRAAVLTGYAISAGTVAATDTVLQAFNKIGNFISGIATTIRGTALTGLSVATGGAITPTDTVLVAFGKLQNQITGLVSGGEPGDIVASVRSTKAGHLLTDGSNISRTTFATLFAVMPSRTATVTISIASPGVVTWTAHGLTTGMSIQFSTTGVLPTGIVAGTVYFVRIIDANSFHLFDTKANAMNTGATTGRINTSGTQSGVHTGLSYVFGNGDGSTTFGIPDTRGVVPRGAGTSAGFITNVTIALGEQTDDAFQGHRHGSGIAFGASDDGFVYGNTTDDLPGISNGNIISRSAGSVSRQPLTSIARTDGTNATPRPSSETRGKSIGLNYFIKF